MQPVLAPLNADEMELALGERQGEKPWTAHLSNTELNNYSHPHSQLQPI